MIWILLTIYILSVCGMWLYFHLYFGTEGKDSNPIERELFEAVVVTLMPFWNTLMILCWFFDFPLRKGLNLKRFFGL